MSYHVLASLVVAGCVANGAQVLDTNLCLVASQPCEPRYPAATPSPATCSHPSFPRSAIKPPSSSATASSTWSWGDPHVVVGTPRLRLGSSATSCASDVEYRLASTPGGVWRRAGFIRSSKSSASDGDEVSPQSTRTRRPASASTAASDSAAAARRSLASDGVSSVRVTRRADIAAAKASPPARTIPGGSIAAWDPARSAHAASHTPKTHTPVTSPGSYGCARRRAACERRDPRCEHTTAFGRPVEPPVWMTWATSSGPSRA